MTVVGIPAKIVRVHGKKDEPVVTEVEEKREYYVQLNSRQARGQSQIVWLGYLYDSSKKRKVLLRAI